MRIDSAHHGCHLPCSPPGAQWDDALAPNNRSERIPAQLSIRPGIDTSAGDAMEISNLKLRALAETDQIDKPLLTASEWRPVRRVHLPEIQDHEGRHEPRNVYERAYRITEVVSRGNALDVLV